MLSSAPSLLFLLTVVSSARLTRERLAAEVKAMDSIKEKLRHMVELLTEEEAQQVFQLLSEFQRQQGISLTMRWLASDPMFKLPADPNRPFRKVKPVQGQGQSASDLLSEDRG